MRAPSKGFDRELQVGLFVFLSCLIIAAFSFRITDSPIFRKGNDFVVYLSDATGIFKNSKVKMAGIDIGIIKKIELDKGKAKITILVDEGNEIPKGAVAVPRPLGILGDKYLEIQLPADSDESSGLLEPEDKGGRWSVWSYLVPEAAAETSRKLYQSGETIQSKENAATMDDVLKKVGDASTDLKEISADVKVFVKSNKKELTDFISSLNRISSKIERTLDDLDPEKLSNDIRRLSEAAGELGQSAKNVRSITEKIDKGEGTIGKLVNDPETVDQLNRTLNTINAVVERARRTRIIVDVTGEQLFDNSVTKTYAGLTIMPREDVGYGAQLVFDPAGTQEQTVIEESVNGGPKTTTTKTITTLDKMKYSLQFIKKVGPLGVRLGVFESSGGVALDWELWRRTLWLSAEAFDFGRDNNNAHFKTYARMNFLRYFNVNVGVDDFLAKKEAPRDRSFFAGLGLHFDDEDIKMLFVLPGVP